jgi:hypothetical protein
VVTGAGGNGFNQFTIAAPAWSAFREADYYEYLRVTVSPSSLTLDAIRADTGAVFDSATIGRPSSSVTLSAAADATIAQGSTVNAGAGSRLTADNSPVSDALLRFVVPASCSSPHGAALALTVGSGTDNGSSKGGDLYAAADNGWSEGSVIWDTAPARSGAPVATLGAVTIGSTYSVDVSSLVTGPGPVTIRIGTTSGDAAAYWSKEGSSTQGPRLTVSC